MFKALQLPTPPTLISYLTQRLQDTVMGMLLYGQQQQSLLALTYYSGPPSLVKLRFIFSYFSKCFTDIKPTNQYANISMPQHKTCPKGSRSRIKQRTLHSNALDSLALQRFGDK